MKLQKSIALMLIIASLSGGMLTSCQKNASSSSNPFENLDSSIGDNSSGNSNTNTNADSNGDEGDDGSIKGIWMENWLSGSDYDADAPHGELKLYKGTQNYVRKTLTSYNGMIIEWGDNDNIYCYDVADPLTRSYLCFDPTCQHYPGNDLCVAHLSDYSYKTGKGENLESYSYPSYLLVDSFDHEASPVMYMAYRRSHYFTVNGVLHERESVSCIERFDMTTGQRTAVLEGVQNTIDGIYSYGDYIYFIEIDGEDKSTLSRVHKAGGKTETLQGSGTTSYEILAVWENQLYYLIDSRYLATCDLALQNEQQVLSLEELKGYGSDATGLIAGIFGEYLYYFADLEEVLGSVNSDGNPKKLGWQWDFYRIPLSNLSASPELIVENMVYDYLLTDDTLFYQPAVFEEVDLSQYDYDPNMYYLNPINESNGTVYALDLNTMETTTVCKDTGLSIFFKRSVNAEDDGIAFTAWPYTLDAIQLAGGSHNMIFGSKSGGELKIWYNEYQAPTYEN